MPIAFFGGCLELTLAACRCPRQAAGPLAGIFRPGRSTAWLSLTITPGVGCGDRVLSAIGRVRTITGQGITAPYGRRERRDEGTSALQSRGQRQACRSPDPDRRPGTRARSSAADVPRWLTASVHVRGRTPSVGLVGRQAERAEEIARTLLEKPLPRRWAHTQGVAARARTLAPSSATPLTSSRPLPGFMTSATRPRLPLPVFIRSTVPAISATANSPVTSCAVSRLIIRAPSSRPDSAGSPMS